MVIHPGSNLNQRHLKPHHAAALFAELNANQVNGLAPGAAQIYLRVEQHGHVDAAQMGTVFQPNAQDKCGKSA